MDRDRGAYRTAQLLKAGETAASIRAAARAGGLDDIGPGWWAVPTADRDVVAAVRAGGVLSCVSALKLYGLWIAPGYPGLHVRCSRHGEENGKRRCSPFGRQPPTRHAVDDLPTALACATKCMSDEDWIAAVDSALNQKLTTLEALQRAWPRIPRRVLNMLGKCDGRAQSGTETIVRLRLRALGFHVEVQKWIDNVGWVDLVVGRLVIECDSRGFHTSKEARTNDARRDRHTQIGNRIVVRIMYDEVLYCWPEVLADIRAFTDADRHRDRRRR
ncbi:hypothetical protein HH308_02640 [Gordonia sp. TBRC 11910]|uniref:Very-short-patch-repair endonuclease n=1 Tax=Gordonia asplenii TaxID=2725283 RepID=A0A848KQ07_9ACTN|nr:hypothetical protein [Gordonia asplenii]NMO00109.1 hypothetical protein [Gordonia asplenii]